MVRSYHEEEQSYKQNPWTWVVLLAICLGALLSVANGLYWQLLKGEQWGDMSDGGLILLASFPLFMCALISWLILSVKLQVVVDTSGVSYKFFPQQPKWVKISKEEIARFTVEKRNLRSAIRHLNDSEKVKSMNVNGRAMISLELKNGKKIRLGSANPEGFAWAMKKLFSSNEIN
jgi:hypothetical protein